MKWIVFLAHDDLYIIKPNDDHTEESWSKTKDDMKKKFQQAREAENSNPDNHLTDGGTKRDYSLGLKLLSEHSEIWRCTVIEAEKHPGWEFSTFHF